MRIGGLQRCSLIDYPGRACAIIFTIGCNFRCPYCHNPELVDETADVLSEAEVLSFLKKRRGLLEAVTITGGEPTVHADLASFVARIKSLGFLVKLDTNGTNPNALANLCERRLVDYVAMDIKAPLAKYAATVARPVDLVRIQESIRFLITGTVPYEFRTTVVKALLAPEDIRGIGELINGAHTYYLQKFVPTKLLNPAFIRKTTYSDGEYRNLLALVAPHVTNCYVR